jgi:ClpP class serine protease
MLKFYQNLMSAPLAVSYEQKVILEAIMNNIAEGKMTFEGDKEDAKETASYYVDAQYQRTGYLTSTDKTSNVAVYGINGTISNYDYYYDTSSTRALMRQMRENDGLESVKAHIAYFNSGGGDASSIEETARFIKTKISKPKIAIISGGCQSAAYAIALGFDKIYASSKMDKVGSIGVISVFRDTTQGDKRYGIQTIEIKADQSDLKNSEIEAVFAGDSEPYKQAFTNPIAQNFIDLVKEFRPATIGHDEVYRGKTYLAQDAQAVGLIDGYMLLDDCIQECLMPEKAPIVLTPSNPFMGNKAEEKKFDNPKSELQMRSILDLFGVKVKGEATDKGFVIDQESMTALQEKALEQAEEKSKTEREKLEKELADTKAEMVTIKADLARVIEHQSETAGAPLARANDPAPQADGAATQTATEKANAFIANAIKESRK